MLGELSGALRMTQIQVAVTKEQARRLEALARKRKTSTTTLVREGIEMILQQPEEQTDPLLDLIGQAGRVGRQDISDDHDTYLATQERKRSC